MTDLRVIFAMGGGGFTMEPRNPALDDFVLSLAPKPEPRILFLPTASGDPDAQIHAFHRRFHERPCEANHLSLFRLHGSSVSLADQVMEHDIVYVGGGSMRNLMAIWRAHGLDRILAEAWQAGVVLAGLSAGAMCWFAGGVTCSSGPPLPTEGLGLLPWSFSVHADSEPARRAVWIGAIRSGALPGGWAADDGVGLLFRGRRLERVVSSRPGARAESADATNGPRPHPLHATKGDGARSLHEVVRRRVEPELLVEPPRESAAVEELAELRSVRKLRRQRGHESLRS